jgi:hypothetical protein
MKQQALAVARYCVTIHSYGEWEKQQEAQIHTEEDTKGKWQKKKKSKKK